MVEFFGFFLIASFLYLVILEDESQYVKRELKEARRLERISLDNLNAWLENHGLAKIDWYEV